jgi:hypothetical protein
LKSSTITAGAPGGGGSGEPLSRTTTMKPVSRVVCTPCPCGPTVSVPRTPKPPTTAVLPLTATQEMDELTKCSPELRVAETKLNVPLGSSPLGPLRTSMLPSATNMADETEPATESWDG